MKKILQFAAVAMLLTGTLISCSKKDSSTTTTTSSSSLAAGKCQISAKISGATSASFSSTLLMSSALKNATLINLSGGSASGLVVEQMLLGMSSNLSVGTYNFATDKTGLFAFSYAKDGKGWAAADGDDFTVNITKSTATEIEGTFSGKMINETEKTTITVSEGKFAGKF